MKRIFVSVILILFLVSCLFQTVYAQDDDKQSQIYDEQQLMSGADSLFTALDDETKESLQRIGIDAPDADILSQIDTGKFFSEIATLLTIHSKTPLSCLGISIGIMLLCALVEGCSLSLHEKAQGTVLSLVGTLSLTAAIVVPVCQTIGRVCEVLEGVSGFMLLYIPIMAGLMIASGQEISGASYYGTMMVAGQVVSRLSSKLVMPLLNIFLGMSVTSAISPRMNLKAFCDMAYKVAKWILTFITILFVTLLTVQSLVTSSMDAVTNKTLRFAVSSFVPVVGGTLGDALSAVSGSLKLLKSGAGVFAIIGASFIFLPILLECCVWQFSLLCTSTAGNMFGLKQFTSLLEAVSKVISMMIAMLVCLMLIFIVTTVIILIVGKN